MVLLPRSRLDAAGLGSSAFARHYSRNHCCFLLLRLLRCFSSAGSPPSSGMSCLLHDGLPHSDICGSTLICNSPQLFAACHVLLRLREPRHPPCALPYFILSITSQFPSSLLYALLVSPSIMSMNFFSGYSILYPSLVENKGVEPLTPSLQS